NTGYNRGSVATGAKVVTADKGKKATAAMAVVPVAEGRDTTATEKVGKKTRGREKVDEAKSRKFGLPPSLQLSPSIMPPFVLPLDPTTTQQIPP
ncbi:hypothetical protein Dimus_028987, partial [Dionaea muscipula]